jgi:hypothetical protein
MLRTAVRFKMRRRRGGTAVAAGSVMKTLRILGLVSLSVAVGCSRYVTDGFDGDLPSAAAKKTESTPESDPALYVSRTSGNDANPGTRAKPFQSIGAAMAYLEANKLEGREVRVCQGDYPESNLQLRSGIRLLGSFNCAMWQRSELYGSASAFKDPNLTRIVRSGTSSNANTVSIEGAARTELSGFEVVGGVAHGSAAIMVLGGELSLEDCLIVGSNDAPRGATVAVSASKAKLDVSRSELRGGAGATLGKGAQFASIALRLENSAGSLRHNILHAGSGKGSYGAAGIVIVGGEDVVIEGNVIRGADSTGTLGGGTDANPFSGIWARGAGNLNITDNTIVGGTSVSAPLAQGQDNGVTLITGVNVSARTTNLMRNRITSGNLVGAKLGYCYGAFVLGGTTRLINNAIFSGCEASTSSQRINTAGVVSYGPIIAEHNTIYAAKTRAFEHSTVGVTIAGYAENKGRFEGTNNIVVADDGVAFEEWVCSGAALGPVGSNVFYAPRGHINRYAGTACATNMFSSFSDDLAPNRLLVSDLTKLFRSGGSETWFDAAFIANKLEPSCDSARRGTDIRARVPNDLVGAVRSETPTPGAWEIPSDACNQ